MRIAIVGAGAIGCLLAYHLARSGQHISLLARGATLSALRAQGVGFSQNNTVQYQAVTARASAAELGEQDFVFLTVKSHALGDLAAQLSPLIGPNTRLISAMNGVPWWFFHGLNTPPLNLPSVDSSLQLAQTLPANQVIGCVVHLAASGPAPGVVAPKMGNKLILGQPNGLASPELSSLAQTLTLAGFEAPVCDCIQREIWFKLWGNMTMNPISCLTLATADRVLDDDLVRALITRCMREAQSIGAAIGLPIDAQPEERHDVTRQLGAFKTSMLQDLEADKPLELDALVGAVRDMATQLNIATPNIDAVYGLTRLLAQSRGLYSVK